ncbi:MAG: ATP synthase F1 subunit gamma [Planctomycetota bacterium]|nr:ATP synthase F1 subunit gamma [Planctomycetota bacterium]
MASAKDLKKKIQSISNTRKITRTMEMVSAAKAKQTQGRVEDNTPYSRKLAEILESLCSGSNVHHYLLGDRDGLLGDRDGLSAGEARGRRGAGRNALLVVTANRGLCGGYNTRVSVRAEMWIESRRSEGCETDVSMVGKKGIARFRYKNFPVKEQYTHIDDRPSFREAEELAGGFMDRFRADEVDGVWVMSTRYHSAGVQRPALTQLLPIVPPRKEEADESADKPSRGEREFFFEPDSATILDALLPFSVCQLLYRLLLEAAASEQIARRMAMKLATDNAEELIRTYTRKYNRQRQAGITQEIMEVVAGAEALD